jgi:hypothetical protein
LLENNGEFLAEHDIPWTLAKVFNKKKKATILFESFSFFLKVTTCQDLVKLW